MNARLAIAAATSLALVGATSIGAVLVFLSYTVAPVLLDMPILVASYAISLSTFLLSPALLLVQRITTGTVRRYWLFALVMITSVVVFAFAMNMAHRDADGFFWWWPFWPGPWGRVGP